MSTQTRATPPIARAATCFVLICARFVCFALPGCHRTRNEADAGTHSNALRNRPKTRHELPTTSASIYLGNLDAQISELTRLTIAHPDILPNVIALGGAHYLRGRYRNDLDEMQQGIDGASACIRTEPANAGCYVTRAEEEQSLHRFGDARVDLTKGAELGADPARVASLQAELDYNDGRYDLAIPAIRKARIDHPSVATWMREAQLDHELGLDDKVDAEFEAAEDMIVDTAPFPVAHLNVQRGMVHAQRGQLEAACQFFREAVTRMPSYVAANEHLAEALHALGNDDEAIAIYESVVKWSEDPEFAHALAVLYQAKGRGDDANALEGKARAGYEALLFKYPEAMYWHASEYYEAIGENAKALDLLQKNLVLRPNSTSYVALAKAQWLTGNDADAKAAIDKGLAMPLRSASLFWTASVIARRANAGNPKDADAYLAQSKALNPRIEDDEKR